MEKKLTKKKRSGLDVLSPTAGFLYEYSRARHLLDKDGHLGYDSILTKLIESLHVNQCSIVNSIKKPVINETADTSSLYDELEVNNQLLNVVDRTAELVVNNISHLSPAKKKKLKKKKNSTKTTTTTTIVTKSSVVSNKRPNQETIDVNIKVSQTTSESVELPVQKKKKKSSTSSNRRSIKKLTETIKTTQHRVLNTTSTCQPANIAQSTIPSTPKTVKLVQLDNNNSKTIRAVANNYVNNSLTNTVKQAQQPSMKMLEAIQDSVTSSGKVKQMIELVEARMKHVTNNSVVNSAQKVHATSSILTPATSKLASVRKLQFPPSSTKKVSKENVQSSLARSSSQTSKISRSSIDKRKIRISSTKSEAKRQSIKKLNSILNDLVQAKIEPVEVDEPQNTELQQSGQFFVKQEPIEFEEKTQSSLLSSTTKQANLSTNKIKKALTNNIAVQNQYRIASNSQLSSSTLYSNNKLNVPAAKNFLDRNTPSKLTKTEMEEKKKAELAFKEKKDQERLLEREKLLQEKVEIAKKKREEQMKKIEEFKMKKQEEEQKRKEEMDAKLEEQKKRALEEKRKEEASHQIKMKESQQAKYPHHTAYQSSHLVNMSNNIPAPIHNSTVIIDTKPKPNLASVQSVPIQHGVQDNILKTISNNQSEYLSTFKGSKTPLVNKNTSKIGNPSSSIHGTSSPKTTIPMKYNFIKKKMPENYDVGDLRSDDETDDEEQPSKPIPAWARDPLIKHTAMAQSLKFINFTKLFKSASKSEIVLENIFKTRTNKFHQRSSSANWSSPPIWASNGITGVDESFIQIKNAMN